MLRRPAFLALFATLAASPHATASAGNHPAVADAAAGAPVAAVPARCRGVALERFERDLPADTRRHVVGAHLAQPFAQLWAQAGRADPAEASSGGPVPDEPLRRAAPPASAVIPDAVTVYARQSEPLLIAYRTGTCVVAVLKLPRDRLWRMLRERLGQSV